MLRTRSLPNVRRQRASSLLTQQQRENKGKDAWHSMGMTAPRTPKTLSFSVEEAAREGPHGQEKKGKHVEKLEW
jgi:hypothetical protein